MWVCEESFGFSFLVLADPAYCSTLFQQLGDPRVMRASTLSHTKEDMAGKLDEIRAAVAECNVVEDGATQEARQWENARRIRVFGMLDTYAQELSAGVSTTPEPSSKEVEVTQQQTE